MSEETNNASPLSKIAALLCVAPIVGLAYTVWILLPVFEAASNVSTDDSALRQSVGQSLFVTAVGLILAFVGFPLSLWCIFASRQRPWWLVTASAFAGCLFTWLALRGTWTYLHRPQAETH